VPTSLVTGGAGFLGSHLCDRLLADGHRVLCVDNLDTGTLENIEHIRDPAFVFVQHDLIENLEIGEPVDEVFHLASPASPIDYLRLPLHTLKVGSYGTHNALGLAKRHRARFLLASTSEGILRLIRSDHHEPVNIGNPGEFTILELAEVVVRLTASRSAIVFEALPIDDPAVRRPDIALAQELLDWSPAVELEDGLRRTLAGMGRGVPLAG